MKLKGRYACVTVNASTTEKVVAELNKQDLDRASDVLITPVFGSDGWQEVTAVSKKYTGTFEGYYDPTDITGLAVLQDSMEEGTLLNDIRFYYKYATEAGKLIHYDTPADGECCGVVITNLKTRVDVNGVGEISFAYEGCGGLISRTEVLT